MSDHVYSLEDVVAAGQGASPAVTVADVLDALEHVPQPYTLAQIAQVLPQVADNLAPGEAGDQLAMPDPAPTPAPPDRAPLVVTVDEPEPAAAAAIAPEVTRLADALKKATDADDGPADHDVPSDSTESTFASDVYDGPSELDDDALEDEDSTSASIDEDATQLLAVTPFATSEMPAAARDSSRGGGLYDPAAHNMPTAGEVARAIAFACDATWRERRARVRGA